MKKIDAIFIVLGLVIIGGTYFVVRKKKSFLKMSEAEKKNTILDEEKKLWDIRNNPKLTEEEKYKQINDITKKNEEIYTEEEKKARGDMWLKELQAGNIKLKLTPFDMGVFPTGL